jgi:hypothetical protein
VNRIKPDYRKILRFSPEAAHPSQYDKQVADWPCYQHDQYVIAGNRDVIATLAAART